jgi:7-keto-8-aminopelargonate synthetase-like enzyme
LFAGLRLNAASCASAALSPMMATMKIAMPRAIERREQQRQRQERVQHRLEFEEAEELEIQIAAAAPVLAELLIAAFFRLANDALRQMPAKPQAVRREHRRDHETPLQIAGRERRIQRGEHREVHRPADVDVTEVAVADAEQPQSEHHRDHEQRAEQQ